MTTLRDIIEKHLDLYRDKVTAVQWTEKLDAKIDALEAVLDEWVAVEQVEGARASKERAEEN